MLAGQQRRSGARLKQRLQPQPDQQISHIRHVPLPAPPSEHSALVQLACDGPQRHMTARANILHHRRQIVGKPVGIRSDHPPKRHTSLASAPADAGALMDHFSGLDAAQLARLEKVEGSDRPIASLSNVLRLHRPRVIVDEAHNARTALSFDTLQRFDPSIILELTATPQLQKDVANEVYPSNVLFRMTTDRRIHPALSKMDLSRFCSGQVLMLPTRHLPSPRRINHLHRRPLAWPNHRR